MKTRLCRTGGSIGARPAAGLCVAALLGAVPMIATAQAYPAQPLKLIVPYTAGGAADVIARQLSQGLAEALGQSVLIDNRPGANTIVAAEVTARSAPDGYTLLLAGSSTVALNPAGYKSLPYDVARDFAPVARVVSNYHLIVSRKGFAPNNVAEFVALAKKKPDSVSYGSTGVGSPTHLSALLIEAMAGVKMLHVPYKGISQVVTDLLGESVDIAASAPTAVISQVKAAKLKGLAATSEARLPTYPDVPTMSELGYKGFSSGAWYVIVVRAGTPAAVLARLNRDINRVLQQAGARKVLEAEAFTVDAPSTQAETLQFIGAETQKWAKVIRDAKLQFD